MREPTPDTRPEDFSPIVDGANFALSCQDDWWEVRFDRRTATGEVHHLMFSSSHYRESFEKVHGLWPMKLNLTEYEEIPEVCGCHFPQLTAIHQGNENSEELNIIEYVIECTLYQHVHLLARERLSPEGIGLDLSSLSADILEKRFLENFQRGLTGDI